MAVLEQEVIPLEAGAMLSREEFLRRWEGMPNLKKAELIRGIVYMPSPLSVDHGESDSRSNFWLSTYALATPGCRSGQNVTTLMLEDSPQPDAYLRILPEYGGSAGVQGRFLSGAPELIVEVCFSSTSYGLHQKLELYREAGVAEYITLLLHEKEVRWHKLADGEYRLITPDARGIIRSAVFCGTLAQREGHA